MEKVEEIRAAIERSETAKKHGAGVVLYEDGKIEYVETRMSRCGHPYEARTTLGEILMMLEQPDLLRLKAKYGRGRNRELAAQACVAMGLEV